MSANHPGYDHLQERIRSLKTPAIGVWENKYADRDYAIKIETSEFTCVGPKTGLPDFAQIWIEYVPDKVCVELKSFKEYLLFFRDIGIFHEHLTNRVLEDLVKACRPRSAKIRSEFNSRGGIKTTVEAAYNLPS
ncbi:MAG: preQ(1) synthase [Candidatus Omnitrophica bacterium]|nr:preQ(1) synthase [Candidatus Omnitrophota bacterium]